MGWAGEVFKVDGLLKGLGQNARAGEGRTRVSGLFWLEARPPWQTVGGWGARSHAEVTENTLWLSMGDLTR